MSQREQESVCQQKHSDTTQVKDIITPADILKVFESDFTEKFSEEVLVSQHDIKFLAKLKEGIKLKPNGHYVTKSAK